MWQIDSLSHLTSSKMKPLEHLPNWTFVIVVSADAHEELLELLLCRFVVVFYILAWSSTSLTFSVTGGHNIIKNVAVINPFENEKS